MKEFDGAGYGNRTRLAGLGSQSITTMLTPQTQWIIPASENQRSPLSPKPDFTFRLAFLRRSAGSARFMPSISLKRPFAVRLAKDFPVRDFTRSRFPGERF